MSTLCSFFVPVAERERGIESELRREIFSRPRRGAVQSLWACISKIITRLVNAAVWSVRPVRGYIRIYTYAAPLWFLFIFVYLARSLTWGLWYAATIV